MPSLRSRRPPGRMLRGFPRFARTPRRRAWRPAFGRGDQFAAHRFDHSGTVVDVSGVELHEVGPGVEHRPHVAGRHQSADPDDGVGSARTGVDAAHDLHGAVRERCAAEASAADLFERRTARVESSAAVGSVGGHDPVERRFEQHVGDLVDHLVRHVGRDFEHDRPELVLPAPEVEQRVEYLKDMFARVRRAFAAGVVAADVDGEIVRILVEAAEEFEVVRRSVLGGGRGVLADVAAHDHAVVRAPQVADGGFQSAVRQTDAVDDGIVLREAEDPRPRVARLRTGRHGPHLDESESQRGQFAERLAVVVESCGQPDGVGETDAEHLAFERRMLHGVAFAQQPAAAGYQPDDAQQQQHRVVGLLDGKREKYGLYDSPVHGS